MSRQKDLIFGILCASHSHPTAVEIYDAARKEMPHISLGTVYRNLAVLCNEKAIIRLPAPDGADRYDFMYTHHWHASCRLCGRIVDIEPDKEITDKIALLCGGMKPVGVSFDCICNECKSK